MRRLLAATGAIFLLMAVSAVPAIAAGDVLSVCLDEDLPPLSAHHRGMPDSGFDVALAGAVAGRLGRPLKIQWFESKLDEDSSPALEANALLSDGRCSLVGSYALTKDSLVVPGVKTAKLPGFEGGTGADRRRRVPLGVLAPSQPYIYSPLTIALGPKGIEKRIEKTRGQDIAGIGDLAGLRIGIESGTLADAILMTFDHGRLIDDITHLVPGRDDLLGALDRGDFDATLLDLRRFDAYRAAKLRAFARSARSRRARKHRVFGGEPTLAAAALPSGDSVLDRSGTQHARRAEDDETRALRIRSNAAFERDRSKLRYSAVDAFHFSCLH